MVTNQNDKDVQLQKIATLETDVRSAWSAAAATGLRSKGVSASDLPRGFSAQALIESDYTVRELRESGTLSDHELRMGGCGALELRNAGASILGLSKAGFDQQDLLDADFCAEDVRQIENELHSLKRLLEKLHLREEEALSEPHLTGPSKRLDEDHALGILHVLRHSKSIQSLRIQKNSLGGKGGKMIAEALEDNTLLQELNIESNELGPEAGKAFASALSKNSSLTSMKLYDNDLGPGFGKVMASALKGNCTLQTLDISFNRLETLGGKEIALALSANNGLTSNGLTSLNLSSNGIGPDAGTAIGQALATNLKLMYFDVCQNSLGVHGGQAIVEALERAARNGPRHVSASAESLPPYEPTASTSTTTVFDVSSNGLDDATKRKLHEAASEITCRV